MRIEALLESKPGTRLTAEKIDRDEQSLYESGLVDDCSFLVEQDGEMAHLIVEVDTPGGPTLSFARGNTLFSDGYLAQRSGIRAGKPITKAALSTASRRIEGIYLRHGYPGTKVTATSFHGGEPTTDDYIFDIEEPREAQR